MDIKKVLKDPVYNCLKEDDLKNYLIFLTFGGSISYGTNLPGSDIDIRGIYVPSKKDILGLKNPEKKEQIEFKDSDTVIYDFNKIFNLFLDCNPNTIEMLFTLPEHKVTNEIGDILVENRNLFLSQLAINSFNGFGISQLHRLQNALSRDGKMDLETQLRYEKDRLNGLIEHFNNVYNTGKYGNLSFDFSEENLDTGILLNCNLKEIPLKKFSGMSNEITAIKKAWEKVQKLKEREKDFLHLNKHAMHTVRLYLMGIDILLQREVSTYRGSDYEHNLLMDIRNGKFLREDGSYDPRFFELVKKYQKQFAEASDNTKLQKIYDFDKVNELFISINELLMKESYSKLNF